jgi:protein ImuA
MEALATRRAPAVVDELQPGVRQPDLLGSTSPAERSPPSPETLHPALWLGHQLGRAGPFAIASGFAALDAELPGGGWPTRSLTELLLPHAGVGEIRLLAASLATVQRAGRIIMVFDPPALLSADALGSFGIDATRLLVVRADGEASLWAVEQALKSGHVGATVAWLPARVAPTKVRRLQLAAQAHDGPAFAFRGVEVAKGPTAAPLRLALEAGGADRLIVHLLKRRGPPLGLPIALELSRVLSATAAKRSPRAGLRPHDQTLIRDVVAS